MPLKVLITGGSGFLGQHLIEAFDGLAGYEVGFTYRTQNPIPAHPCAYRMDLVRDPGSVRDALAAFRPDVVIHTAAQASPAACARDPAGAFAANAPAALLDALEKAPPQPLSPTATVRPTVGSTATAATDQPGRRPLLIYISTDQVYSGTSSAPYREGDPAAPVNDYGASKLAFEDLLRQRWGGSNGKGGGGYVILRSSNLVGGPAPYTGATKFLQWLEGQLFSCAAPATAAVPVSTAAPAEAPSAAAPSSAAAPAAAVAAAPGPNRPAAVELFEDEVRSFVHVDDVKACLVRLVATWKAAAAPAHHRGPGNSGDDVSGGGRGAGEGGYAGGDGEGDEGGGDEGERGGAPCLPGQVRAMALAGGWRDRGATYNMGGPQALSRVGLARALTLARQPRERGRRGAATAATAAATDDAADLAAAPAAAPATAPATAAAGLVVAEVVPVRRADLDAALGYRSPRDIGMDSSALEAAAGLRFRPMLLALAQNVDQDGGGSGGGVSGGGTMEEEGCGTPGLAVRAAPVGKTAEVAAAMEAAPPLMAGGVRRAGFVDCALLVGLAYAAYKLLLANPAVA